MDTPKGKGRVGLKKILFIEISFIKGIFTQHIKKFISGLNSQME